jgi:hypothetical protein
MRLPIAPGRDLDRRELAALAANLGAQPEVWEPHAPAGDGQRHFVSLHRDDHVDVWAIFWMPENDTGWHDHDLSSGAVSVVRGSLVEHALRIGAPHRRRAYSAGSTFCFGPAHIHRMTCEDPFAVSIHAYSPPLWRLGQYLIEPDGALRRVSVSYADELRPLEPVPR